MYLLLILLPFISFIINFFFGRCIGRIGSLYMSIILMFTTWIFVIIGVYESAASGALTIVQIGDWLNLGLLNVKWFFLFDALTNLMLFVVVSVSFFVHLYSLSYMENDPHFQRFISYLSLFTFFMIILVTAGNFFQMFLGWEGVGLASYLLIGFWYSRFGAVKSSIKAMVINRIGDFGMILAIILIYSISQSLDYTVYFPLTPYYVSSMYHFLNLNFYALDLISLLLFVGVCGKSAQLGLHVWLPDAMEGPTPVSALIHAATMVTAGVFILVRASIIFEFSNFVLSLIVFIGSLTAFVAATVGIFQNDIKRIIAYSTCSQLGYMVLSAGLSFYFVSFFHLFTHAFFKALLFLGAGSIIHAMSDDQDLRRYGGLLTLLPFSYVLFWLGSLALIGFPFLAGFYSKDLILELVFCSFKVNSFLTGVLGLLAAFCTAFYSFKIIYLTFFAYSSSYRAYLIDCSESAFYMFLPLFSLSLLSIFVGFFFTDLVVSVGSGFWFNSTSFWFYNNVFFDLIYLNILFKLSPLFFSILGGVLSFSIYYFYSFFTIEQIYLAGSFKRWYEFFNRKWYFDNVYNDYILLSVLSFGYFFCVKLVDKGLLEFLGPFGLKTVITNISVYVSIAQSGFIYHYAYFFLFGLFFIINLIFFLFSQLLNLVLYLFVFSTFW